MKHLLFCLMLTSTFLTASGSVKKEYSDSGFFEQEESAQHLLIEKGDTFRFFRHNMICNNWKLASFDSQEKTDEEPSLHLLDDDSKTGTYLHSHNPIACQPYTQYRLRFKLKVKAMGGGVPPEVAINQFDFNRDYLGAAMIKLTDEKVGGGWLDRELFFITPHDCHVVMLQLVTRGTTIADLIFDEVYLEQISETGAFRPQARSLLQAINLSNDWKKEETLLPEEEACLVDFDFSWDGAPDGAQLIFEWSRGTKRLGIDCCQFSAMRGVQPQWSGTQAEWKRNYGDSADGVSVRLDQFVNTSGERGAGSLAITLKKPKGVDRLAVRVQRLSSALQLEQIQIQATPLEIPNAGRFLPKEIQ